MAQRETGPDPAKGYSGLVPAWLRVQLTPPTLAGGSLQAAELELLDLQQRRGTEGVFDEEALAGLAESPWLRQDVQARGAYISTSGLRAELDHPELAMLNVPSAAVGWATGVFEAMACYLESEGARFAPGEVYMELTPAGIGAFTFQELSGEAAESIGMEESAGELLLVIPLP